MNPTIKTYNTIEDARAVWMEFQAGGSAYVFQSYQWLDSWYHHIGRRRGVTPFLVAVYDDTGAPVCFLAFGVVSSGSMKVLTWLGDPLNDYGAPIVIGEVTGFSEVWAEIREHLPPVDIVILPRIPHRVNDAANPFCALHCRRYHSSAHYVRLAGTWDEFYEKHASARTRSTDRRKHRRLSDKGEIACRITSGSDKTQFDSLSRVMIEQKAQRYREINARNILDDESYRGFFAAPTEELIASGQLQLAGLFVDGEPVTTHWGMVYDKRFYYYMPSFATGAWRRYSPGRLLLFHLFQWCFDNGIEIFDFTIGDESYKTDWCDEDMPLYEYFEPRTLKGRLYGVFYHTMKTLLGNTLVLGLARRFRGLYYRLRSAGS
jgi:CelD/BcsL family acetyltransferase involved in cellulose biosynthesis